MDEDQQHLVRHLVTDMIQSGRSVEDVCVLYPSLLPEVNRLWCRARAIEDQIDRFFPSTDATIGQAGTSSAEISLPKIPGYDIQSILGFGGMGVVYKARHLSLNRTVAIKVPLAGAFATVTERHRHVREARAVAALSHPNIVTVHEVGDFEGRPYFTMEYIDGETLGSKLSNTPHPVRWAAAMVANLAAAMQHAHQDGVIHRDLKPANILLAPDGSPKITDFGLARHLGGEATLTAAGFEFGTPSYMSPEQATGQPEAQSASVDIYALGAILYEILTGRPPFRAENAVETLRQVLEEDPAPPSRLNPKVPRDLETICQRCLHKDPRRRYPTALALADDLQRFLSGDPIRARPVRPPERIYRWGRKRPAHAALIAAGVCGLVASAGVGFWMQSVKSTRAAEVSVRESRAAQAIETAVALTNDLRTNGRWHEARRVLDGAYTRVGEANSDALAKELDSADRFLTAAWELDDIRRRYPDTSDLGYDYSPAVEAYRRVFDRLGLASEVSPEAASHVVNSSPIRREILVALDNAAFVALVNGDQPRLDRWLTMARMADPDPWRDRFRQPAAWSDLETLEALSKDAHSGAANPPPHQIVIVGVLLGSFNAHSKATEILRNAHRANPIDFWVNLELANSLTREGRLADASQYFRTAVSIQPGNPGPWVSLGVSLNRSGAREEAMIAVQHAIDLNPRIIVAWRNYIAYLRLAGRIDDAEAAVARAVEANPDHHSAFEDLRIGLRWDRARRFASRGEWLPALDEYRSVLPNGPADGEFWFELAAVSLIAGDHDAYEAVRDSMLEPGTRGVLRPALVARAATLTPGPIASVTTAAALSEAELRGQPLAFWSLTQRGAILCRTDRHSEAIPLFEQSIVSDPLAGRVVLNWLWLAMANHQIGKPEEAARWHSAAVAWLDQFDSGMPDDAAALGFHLHNWLESQVLRGEVHQLLSGGMSGEIPESSKPEG